MRHTTLYESETCNALDCSVLIATPSEHRPCGPHRRDEARVEYSTSLPICWSGRIPVACTSVSGWLDPEDGYTHRRFGRLFVHNCTLWYLQLLSGSQTAPLLLLGLSSDFLSHSFPAFRIPRATLEYDPAHRNLTPTTQTTLFQTAMTTLCPSNMV